MHLEHPKGMEIITISIFVGIVKSSFERKKCLQIKFGADQTIYLVHFCIFPSMFPNGLQNLSLIELMSKKANLLIVALFLALQIILFCSSNRL